MKVRVSFTVDIDPEVWEMTYGISGFKAIREDVKEAVYHATIAHLHEIGVLPEKSLSG